MQSKIIAAVCICGLVLCMAVHSHAGAMHELQVIVTGGLGLWSLGLPAGAGFVHLNDDPVALSNRGNDPLNLYNPVGLIGAVTFFENRNLRTGLGVSFPIWSGHYKHGFSDRENMNSSGRYSYSRVSNITPVLTISIGWIKSYNVERFGDSPAAVRDEYGIKLCRFGFSIEQGYEQTGNLQPMRTIKGRGYGLSLYWQHENSYSLELGPIASLDFGRYGKARLRAIGLTLNHIIE